MREWGRNVRRRVIPAVVVAALSVVSVDAQSRHIVQYSQAPTNFARSTAGLRDVAVSPDGLYVASGDADGRLRLYQRDTRSVLAIVRGHAGPVSGLQFAPDSGSLLTCGFDRRLRIWSVPALKPLATGPDHGRPLVALACAPDGSSVAVGGYDASIRLLSAKTGKQISGISSAGGCIRSLSFSGDGRLLASGEEDGIVRIRDALTLEMKRELRGHSGRVRRVVFAPSGTRVASGGADGRLIIRDATDGARVSQAVTGSQVHSLAFSAQGTTLIVGGRDGRVQVVDALEARIILTLEEHDDAVDGLAFLPDDSGFYSASAAGRIFLWPAEAKLRKAAVVVRTDFKAWATGLSEAANRLAVGGRGGQLEMRELTTGARLKQFAAHPETIDRVRFSPDGVYLAVASWKSAELVLWTVADGREWKRFQGDANVRDVAFSPDSRQLAAACQNGTVVLWDLATGKAASAQVDKLPAYSVAFSPDGTALAAASGDWQEKTGGLIRLLKVNGLSELHTLRGHEHAVRSICFQPDGQRLASGAEDGRITVWDVATGRSVTALRSASPVRVLTYSPDGKMLVAGLATGRARVWDVESAKVIQRLQSSRDVFSLCFSPEGTVVWGAGGNPAFRLWDLADLGGREPAAMIQRWSAFDDREEAK